MSRYLGEITNQRQHSYANWRSNQLERRPAPPSGTSAIAWARFQRVSTTDISVASASNTIVTGSGAADTNTDAAIFQINGSAEIQMLVAGLVAVVGHTTWGTYTTSFRTVAVVDIAPVVDQDVAFGGSGNDLFDPVIASGTYRAPVGAKLKLYVNQHSGAGQTLYGGGSALDDTNWLEVQYLGPYE